MVPGMDEYPNTDIHAGQQQNDRYNWAGIANLRESIVHSLLFIAVTIMTPLAERIRPKV
jgi:hypothetical protein